MDRPNGERGGPADSAVVREVLAGDTERFRVLVERYRAEYARYATAMVGDPDTAADVVQDAFIKAYDALATCRDPDRFKAWCFRIVANLCRDAQRRRATAPLDAVVVEARETADGPAENGELAAALEKALAMLTPEQREAFVMKHVEGRSYAEMEQLLETGVDALKMRVHRARDALRKAMGEWMR